MVRQGDVEIRLVHAESKQAFKEHTNKDGKVYVEVEPDAEYFISIQRVGYSVEGTLLVTGSVDEKSLGYHTKLTQDFCPPLYRGLWTCNNGISTNTALKFSEARRESQPSAGNEQRSRLLMGKVEVTIYKGVLDGYIDLSTKSFHLHSNWEASTVPEDLTLGVAQKKCFRSGQGSTSCSTHEWGNDAVYKFGEKVDVFTLNYCSTLGLIHVGVLPKPPVWVHHRMKHPAKKRAAASAKDDSSTSGISSLLSSPRTDVNPRPAKMIRRLSTSPRSVTAEIRPTTMIRSQEIDLYDLTKVDSDDEDDDDESKACDI